MNWLYNLCNKRVELSPQTTELSWFQEVDSQWCFHKKFKKCYQVKLCTNFKSCYYFDSDLTGVYLEATGAP